MAASSLDIKTWGNLNLIDEFADCRITGSKLNISLYTLRDAGRTLNSYIESLRIIDLHDSSSITSKIICQFDELPIVEAHKEVNDMDTIRFKLVSDSKESNLELDIFGLSGFIKPQIFNQFCLFFGIDFKASLPQVSNCEVIPRAFSFKISVNNCLFFQNKVFLCNFI